MAELNRYESFVENDHVCSVSHYLMSRDFEWSIAGILLSYQFLWVGSQLSRIKYILLKVIRMGSDPVQANEK